jgi:hypothetical protein
MKGIGEVARELAQDISVPVAQPANDNDDCCASEPATAQPACGHMKKGPQDCCSVTRLQIDLNDQIAKVHVAPDFSLPADIVSDSLPVFIAYSLSYSYEPVYPPPLYSGRHLLSLKSVLLI